MISLLRMFKERGLYLIHQASLNYCLLEMKEFSINLMNRIGIIKADYFQEMAKH
jgi:hypothetical protein